MKVNGKRVRLHGGGDWRLGEGQGNTIEELDEMEILQNARGLGRRRCACIKTVKTAWG